MNAVTLVTLLALVQFAFFGALVARARGVHKVPAPATTGPAAFDRINRVHLNTQERLVLFLPLLWLAANAWRPEVAAALGVLFLLGRLLYWRGYVKDPAQRQLGNVLSMLPIAALLIITVLALAQQATQG